MATMARTLTIGLVAFLLGALSAPVSSQVQIGASKHKILSGTHSDSSPSSVSRGDLITGQGATASWARLGLGTSGQALVSDGTDAIWGNVSATSISGILPPANGGLGFGTPFNQYSIIYASAANTWAVLPNTSSTGTFWLKQTNSGGTPINTTWSGISMSDMPGSGNWVRNGTLRMFNSYETQFDGTIDIGEFTNANRGLEIGYKGSAAAPQTPFIHLYGRGDANRSARLSATGGTTSGDDGYLDIWTGAVRLNSTTALQLASGSTTWGRVVTYGSTNVINLSSNLYWTGTQWNLDDTAKKGLYQLLDPDLTASGYEWSVWSATAGTNPRTPTVLASIGSAFSAPVFTLHGTRATVIVDDGSAEKARFHRTNQETVWISNNVSYSGSVFNLDNTSYYGLALATNIDTGSAGTRGWRFNSFTPGTNPRSSNLRFFIDEPGKPYERGRTVPIGDWTDVTYSSGNFTAGGSMTWTVDSGDQGTYMYTVIGTTMMVQFYINNTTVGGTPANDLRIAIPGGYTAATGPTSYTTCFGDDNGTIDVIWAVVSSGGSYIGLWKKAFGAWAASTNNTDVRCTVIFEVA